MQETITLLVAANEAENLRVAINGEAMSLSEGSPIWITLQEFNVQLLEGAKAALTSAPLPLDKGTPDGR